MKTTAFNSLKTRYILFAGLLGIIVVLASFFGYRNVSIVSQLTTENIATRRQILEHVSNIRINIFEGYKALDAFLLDPTRRQFRNKIHLAFHAAIGETKKLNDYSWISEQKLDTTALNLINAFKQLDRDVEELAEIRVDPTRQYPSLALSNNVLQPNRDNLNNAIALVLDDPMHKDTLVKHPRLYKSFVKARHLWTQTLSNFRLYLANRVGSFNEKSLPVQEKAIETLYQELTAEFAELRHYDDTGKLNFEISAALNDMIDSANGWYQGYLDVKNIHHSGDWRADSSIIKNTIEPRLKQIDSLLGAIDKQIEKSGSQDVQALTSVAKLQTTILFLITGIGLTFMSFIILSLQRLIFRPIDYVARALKAEAFNKEGVLLPTVRSRETQNLIDAFSEMRKQVHMRQSDLEHQALHDALTGLPNRTLLHDRMEQAINVARRDHQNLVLLMLDLDRFKEINDTLGHHVGDNVLKEVGIRLMASLRQIDTVARLGGDEYAILLPDTNIADAENITHKIIDGLDNVIIIDELNLFIKASIGLAEYPTHGTDAATLIQHADVAMYIAKRGQSAYAIYNPQDDEYSIGRLALIGDLRDALENNSLKLHYQPIVDLRDGNYISAEALLRWEHDKFGAIPPDQIVLLAEQTGMIDDITYWVLNEASRQCSQWRQQQQQIRISINISMSNLRNPNLIEQLDTLIKQFSLPAECFTLEITESAMMANPKRSLETLLKIHAMGIKLSIDDFGTGFSSLAYLKKLPVSELKIDKSFVMDLLKDENDLAIVRSTIDLAHNLGIKVIAEGVESEEIYNVLRDLNCDAAQGFYISRPLEFKPLISLLSGS